MLSASRERTKAVAGIESRLAHGPIAGIELATEPVACIPRALAHNTEMHVTTGLLQTRCLSSIGMIRCFDKIAFTCFVLGVIDQPMNYVRIVSAVVSHFRQWALAVIVVTRQPRCTSKMLRPDPSRMILFRNRVGMFEPRLCRGAPRRTGGEAGGSLVGPAEHPKKKMRR